MEFTSTSRLERLVFASPSGRSLTYSVVFLEPEVEAALFGSDTYAHLMRGGRLRFTGEVEDIPVQLAWQPARGRGHYVMLSPALCKQLALRVGSEVTVRFDLEDPERVVVPDDIRRALSVRAADAKRWAKLSPGKQRALIAFVESARTDATRHKRIADLFAPLARTPAARRARHPPARR
ncbi:MAG: YdeI/OmpD-associated family protein [Kofleriaceae bacterium]|nr:YdeI/OmpD-associated family protein [Kofleriaceae bacterium]